MKNIHKEKDINIDIETIFNLINDIESYPNYLPWCTKSVSYTHLTLPTICSV